ncbi:c-type cytochrome [Altererythrobacter sp. H2]|uniref:c-type cytochrome n=1 Tax=Altererythrobacter sp. H2 TaxID=3108391 RepID=UPI002B4BECD8|nr:c-type cytochrome [Altererythrobacter sp. H2]WRK96404.1 c-type cytochrome [Altererythrobacter sp. H2]
MRRLVVAALPLAFALAGCGSEPDAPPPGASAPSGDATPAQVAVRPAAFAQCASCHAVVPGKNGIGPSLAGVVGAKSGQEPSFAYSTAMRQSGLVWDEATLDAYLKDPRAVVPGTKMAYAGLTDDAARAELIAWLGTI